MKQTINILETSLTVCDGGYWFHTVGVLGRYLLQYIYCCLFDFVAGSCMAFFGTTVPAQIKTVPGPETVRTAGGILILTLGFQIA